jgi:hypothetical protein
MVSSRPPFLNRSEQDPAQRVAGARVEDGEVEVADEQDEKDAHQSVVDGQRAREPLARVALAVPEQKAADCKSRSSRLVCNQKAPL